MLAFSPTPSALIGAPRNRPMKQLPSDHALSSAEQATEVTRTGAEGAARRAYEAPTLVVFGNVEDFTRGTGTSTTMDRDGSRVKI